VVTDPGLRYPRGDASATPLAVVVPAIAWLWQ